MKIQKKPDISVFFPCYNEEANVGALALKTASVLKKIAGKWEVIAVNDSSKDRTAAVIKALSKKDKRIRLEDRKVNQGYGAAVKSGFRAARHEWIFFTDGDGQFDVEEMAKMVPLLSTNDLVVGYRIKRADPLQRKLNAFAWGMLVKVLFWFWKSRDIDCAFKFVRRSIFDTYQLETTGAMISTELLVKAHKNGFRITEIGVNHYPRRAGTQTGAKLAVIARAFKELFMYAVKWYTQGFR